MFMKYMGLSDIRSFPVGETLGGRLAEPLAVAVVFSSSAGHIVYPSKPPYKDIPEEFWTALQDAEPFQFVVVGGDDELPTSVWDMTFGQAGLAGDEATNILRTGVGAPDDAIGIEGDTYIDLSAKVQYGPKRNGSWGDPTLLNFSNAVVVQEASDSAVAQDTSDTASGVSQVASESEQKDLSAKRGTGKSV